MLKRIEQPPVPDIPYLPGKPGMLGTLGYLIADVGDEGWVTSGSQPSGVVTVVFPKTDRKATVPEEDIELVTPTLKNV
jgi:hypothetical protein